MTDRPWASDVRVSMPAPLEDAGVRRISMGGFCFTEFGLRHELTQSDLDQIRQPTFAPMYDPKEPEISGNDVEPF